MLNGCLLDSSCMVCMIRSFTHLMPVMVFKEYYTEKIQPVEIGTEQNPLSIELDCIMNHFINSSSIINEYSLILLKDHCCLKKMCSAGC